jgi:hypothetical protein
LSLDSQPLPSSTFHWTCLWTLNLFHPPHSTGLLPAW